MYYWLLTIVTYALCETKREIFVKIAVVNIFYEIYGGGVDIFILLLHKFMYGCIRNFNQAYDSLTMNLTSDIVKYYLNFLI